MKKSDSLYKCKGSVWNHRLKLRNDEYDKTKNYPGFLRYPYHTLCGLVLGWGQIEQCRDNERYCHSCILAELGE